MPFSLSIIIWSMMASASFVFAGIHTVIWWRGKSSRRHLLFAMAAIGAGLTAFTELRMFTTDDLELFRLTLRLQHISLYIMLVSIVWYIYVHLHAPRKSFAIVFTALWSVGLIFNFLSPHSLTYKTVTSFTERTFPWGESYYIPIGIVNPWKIFAELATIVLIVFVADASIRSWRRGYKQRAATVGGSILFFILVAGIVTPFADQGVIQIPSIISVVFIAIILAFGYELGIDAFRSTQLSKEVIANERRWRTTLDNIQLLVVELDNRGCVTYVNPYFKTLTGFSEFDVMGKNWVDTFVPEDEKEPVKNVVKDLLNKVDYPHGQNRLLTQNGERRIEWSNVTLIDMDETATGIIGIGADVTEREAAFEEVRQLKEKLEEENIYLKEEIILDRNYSEIIGHSDTLKYALKRVEQVAKLDTIVLLEGETGVGKELFARAVHDQSARKNRPLIKVNCAAIPANLIESELFGHERGAFTGADRKRKGRFELADRGTLFLDEIGELPLELQSKLLRVLDTGEFERLGSGVAIKVDVRVIAATNRVLSDEIEKGNFRRDLYYRLAAFPISVAPLRTHTEDIQPLVQHFVELFNRRMGKSIRTIPNHALKKLMSYPWPGNVRELRNVIERAVIASNGSSLRVLDKIFEKENGDGSMTSYKSLADIEREHMLKVLEACKWRIEGDNGAAKILDMHPNTLRSRMLKLGIERPQ